MMLQYVVVLWIQKLLRHLPYSMGSGLGARAGRLFEVLGIRRNVVEDNLRKSNLPSHDDQTLLSCYEHFGRTFFELLNLEQIDPLEHGHFCLPSDFAEKTKGGAFLLSAHIGNWELMGKALASKIRFGVVAQPLQHEKIDRLIAHQRKLAGMNVFSTGQIWKIKEALSSGCCLAILVDQNPAAGGIPVTFMGRFCLAPSGPFRLVRAFRQLPVYVAYAVRFRNNRHKFVCRQLDIKDRNRTEQVAQQVYSFLEEIIHQNPDQWFWHHRRWKVPA